MSPKLLSKNSISAVEVGGKLRELRLHSTLSLSEVCRRSDTYKSQLSKFENGVGYLGRKRYATILAIVRAELQKHSEEVARAIREDSATAGRAVFETVA
jgi:transcriptional regulator with XRE-family HTH domain